METQEITNGIEQVSVAGEPAAERIPGSIEDSENRDEAFQEAVTHCGASASAVTQSPETQDEPEKAAADSVTPAEAEPRIPETSDEAGPAAADAENPSEGTHFEHIKDTLELLYKYFPKCFIKPGEGDCRPLKIGIFDDIKAVLADYEGLTTSKTRGALRLYTSRLRYLRCLREGEARVDLEGNAGEPVSAEHAQYARERSRDIRKKRKENLKAAPGRDEGPTGLRQDTPEESGEARETAARREPRPPFKARRRFRAASGTQETDFARAGSGGAQTRRTAGVKAGNPVKPAGVRPEAGDLKKGVGVLVLSGESRCVRGTVAQDAARGSVMVTLVNGLTISCSLERVLLPERGQ